ncbi:hypothetical protein FBU31_000208, partial [Coemansia sp. 'formosensis']
SRKSNNHLLRDSPSRGDGPDGVADVVMADRSAVLDSMGDGMGGALALTSPSQAGGGGIGGSPALQCVEVDCLAHFSNEYGLRQHVAAQHPRPIRRAVKPSNRVKPGRGTPTEPMAASFWNTPTINDVLSAVDAAAQPGMGLASMPTIPESGISTPVTQAMDAAVAMAMGYDAQSLAMTPNVGRAVPQAAHRRLMLQGLPTQPFLQATTAPFLSAPALINASGGEPNIGSYFALGLNNNGGDAHAMTPLFGVSTNESMGAAAASMMLEAMSQAGANAQLNLNPTHQDSTAHEGNDDAMAANYLPDMSLNMQLMHSMMAATADPFYIPRDDPQHPSAPDPDAIDDASGSRPYYARSQRSDSFDLSSVATVPSSGSSSSTIQPASMADAEPMVTLSAGSKSGSHSQIATALMSKRNRQQQQQQIQQQASAPTGQQPSGLLPWTHGFSALGLLPFPGDQNRQAMSDGFPQPHHRLYTPQPTDLAQFQFQNQPQNVQQDIQPIAPNSAGPRYQRQFVSTLQLGQLQNHPPPLYTSNSIIQCPVFACRQAFSDANALKHHLSYDHPRDTAPLLSANASNPGSPMEGFLSTMPTNHQAPVFSMAPLSAGAVLQPPRQQNVYVDPGDRTKAPHWIDTNMWSSWIAAANGHGDVTAAAAATAMGITPGISGPQSFVPAASTPQPAYSQATSELLQMFQSRRELEAAYGGGVDNGPTPQAEISGATAPQAGAPSVSTPRVASNIAEVDSNADTTFSVTDLVKVLDPVTLESLMDSCGSGAPTWAKLQKMFPTGKGKLSFFHFTGVIKRDIDAAKIPDLPNKLVVNEALSGATTLATYALAALLYDPRLAELNDGPASTSLDLLCMLICALLQERGKQ